MLVHKAKPISGGHVIGNGTVYFKSGYTNVDFSDIISRLGREVGDFSVNNFRVLYPGGQTASVSADANIYQSGSSVISISMSYSDGRVNVVNGPRAMVYNQSKGGGAYGNSNITRITGIVFDPSDTPFTSN